jgi:hypothetical protein
MTSRRGNRSATTPLTNRNPTLGIERAASTMPRAPTPWPAASTANGRAIEMKRSPKDEIVCPAQNNRYERFWSRSRTPARGRVSGDGSIPRP